MKPVLHWTFRRSHSLVVVKCQSNTYMTFFASILFENWCIFIASIYDNILLKIHTLFYESQVLELGHDRTEIIVSYNIPSKYKE